MTGGGGLRRSVGPHRVPGICLSLLGFLLLFAGIMMVAMGQTIHSSNYKDLKIAGAITLVLGIGVITGGFVYQYVVHRDWKRKRQARLERRKAACAADIVSSNSRAQIYIDNDEVPCTSTSDLATSGSMVNLGITDDDDDSQWRYDPYAGAVIIDDETGHRPNFEEYNSRYENNNMVNRNNAMNKVYDIFTVTPSPTPDIIIHSDQDNLRSTSVSPNIVCHHVIEEPSDSDDEPLGGLSINKLVDQTYSCSPRLTKRSLTDLAAELEKEEHDPEIEPPVGLVKPLSRNKQQTNGAKTQSSDAQTIPLETAPENNEENGLDLPVMKRKQRRKCQAKSTKDKGDKTNTMSVTITDKGNETKMSNSMDMGNVIKQKFAKTKDTGNEIHIKSSKTIDTSNEMNTKSLHKDNKVQTDDNTVDKVIGKSPKITETKTRSVLQNPPDNCPVSPKGKATKGSIIKSSKNVQSQKQVKRAVSNVDSDNWDSESCSENLNHSMSDSSIPINGIDSADSYHTPRDSAIHANIGNHTGHLARSRIPSGPGYKDESSDWDSDECDLPAPPLSGHMPDDTCASRCS